MSNVGMHPSKNLSDARLSASAVTMVAAAVENFRDSHRGRLTNRWLYFVGDSSLRGLYIALLQQLVWRRGNLNSPVMHLASSTAQELGTSNHSLSKPPAPKGWLDIVLEEREDGSWAQLAMSAVDHTCGSGGKRKCKPGVENSRELSTLWCSRLRGTGAAVIRLTYRQMTFLRYAPAALIENERAWERSSCVGSGPASGPDAILFQSGLWDIEHRESELDAREQLLLALVTLRSQGRRRREDSSNSIGGSQRQIGGSQRQLAYASLSMPWPAAHRNDSRGAWQRALVAQANAAALNTAAPHIRFFNQLLNHTAVLSSDCRRGCTLPNHPPHAINVPLLPRMLQAWLDPGASATAPDLSTKDKGPAALSSPRGTAEGRLGRSGFQALEGPTCCCVPPTGVEGRPSTAYWANVCLLRHDHPSS